MGDWVVIATGQSLTQEDVDYVRGKAKVVVVSDAYRMAPWADVLVSHDRKWWSHHKEAMKFAGQKICRFNTPGIDEWKPPEMPTGCNSGLMGMYVAKDRGAKRIIMLGFDMHGTHFFGPHTGPNLMNTTPNRFIQHQRQFARFTGPEVINCTPGSALKHFPLLPLREVL